MTTSSLHRTRSALRGWIPLILAGVALGILVAEWVHGQAIKRETRALAPTRFRNSLDRIETSLDQVEQSNTPPLPLKDLSTPKVRPQAAPVAAKVQLDGILYNPDRPVAILNGRVYATGQDVAGYRIEQITPRHVILKRPGAEPMQLDLYDKNRPRTAPHETPQPAIPDEV